MIPLKKPQIGQLEAEAVNRVLQSGMIAQGGEVESLEAEFSAYCGAQYAVAVNSGTAALHTILMALGVSDGDEVITTPFSFIATASPIKMCGAEVVFADIRKDSFNLDPETVKKKITSKTKAIIGVDLFGLCADWDALQEVADEHGLFLFEDAAQAHGATLAGRKAGSFGNAASFSFYATKNMTTAEGGMITTADEEVYEFARRFRQHGMKVGQPYHYEHIGFNYRMTDIAAAIGRAQLAQLEEWTERRRLVAARLNDGFASLKGLVTPVVEENAAHAYHLYSLLAPAEVRDSLVESIKRLGVGAGIYYPVPLYSSPFLTGDQVVDSESFPVTEEVCSRIFSVPCEPFLDDGHVEQIIAAVAESYDTVARK